ncbi:MAG TPA: Asp-tRNA(Asn)/Glu-tRNA(Gln) amidotransferase subunit GatA [Verrucomicrobiota bacterium]|nr:Asp-tRNA(Asn)/Glu-tRNA(Gln) amidotransferase GatCAB subunit A [Verrucomicrobiales bacterium]HRI14840.1 Asp-tRNA(Asn)/Glu-tRNA(Gln) amidotransferase subunit GatA [Verrucomicrobiota bacterium]
MIRQLDISELGHRLDRRDCSAREALQACFEQIHRVEGQIKAFLSYDGRDAEAQADAADRDLKAGISRAEKPLLGIPVALKDVLCHRGQPCGCASKILQGFVSPYDATVVEKLKAAGAVVFGRLNMDEFAMGSSTENSAYGPTLNPWDTTRIPGGSSGGAAAAVAAHECFASLGSDTGGSIRQPAALCGIVGLKPTYGLVSRYGLVAFASSLDQVGPFTRTVADSATLLGVIAGHDPRDSTSVPQVVPGYPLSLQRDLRGVRLGVVKEFKVGGLAPEVSAATEVALKQLQSLGAELEEVSLPHSEYAAATYYIIAPAEASANLARFDGIRYGLRVDGRDPEELNSRTRGAGFGPEVKRRIILGTYVLSSGYYDAFYLRAQKVRTLIRNDFLKAFEKVDAIVSPTTPTAAFKLGEKSGDPLQMYLSDIFTISCNLAGNCGISVPCGFTTSPKLPIGLQILGRPFGEETIFRIANAFERSTAWHRDRPPLA